MNTVIRVNTRSRTVTSHPVTTEETRWGGRSLVAHLLLREVPPTCEPTGRRNKLILASGLLADTGVTTTGQLSIGGKSPLTGGDGSPDTQIHPIADLHTALWWGALMVIAGAIYILTNRKATIE